MQAPRTPPTPAAPPAPRGLRARFLAWRDRMIADPRFQDWAVRNPFTRPVARRRAQALFDLTAGFVYTQTLLAFVTLDLHRRLAAGPQPAETLAPALGLTTDATERLLAACAALDLVERRGAGHWGLGQLGAALIGAPGVEEMIRHHPVLYRDLEDPVALLRGESAPEMARFWGYVGGHRTHDLASGETAPYTGLMAATQAMVAAEVLSAHDFRRHRCLLDLGGGDGSFLRAVGGQAPRLGLHLMDLPSIAPTARERFAAAGMGDRAQVTGGDFFADPLPAGADAISLIRVAYDHDDAAVLGLLKRAHDALPPGGWLILAEPMAGTRGVPRVGDAYFSFYILAMTHGRPRTAAALMELMRAAGFTGMRERRTRRPMLTGLVTARRS